MLINYDFYHNKCPDCDFKMPKSQDICPRCVSIEAKEAEERLKKAKLDKKQKETK